LAAACRTLPLARLQAVAARFSARPTTQDELPKKGQPKLAFCFIRSYPLAIHGKIFKPVSRETG
jgi:hypothetical protein